MNTLQHCLLKLSEESGEIASELLGNLEQNLSVISNNDAINLEINDLVAVIRILDLEHLFGFNAPDLNSFQEFKDKNLGRGLFFWLKYTIEACMELSKVSSKCIQFGLPERQPERDLNNHERLKYALDKFFFGILCLNCYGLNYQLDDEHVKNKIKKIDRYLNYSVSLGCVRN